MVRSDKIEAVSSCDHPAAVDQTPSTETNISAVTDQNLRENSTAVVIVTKGTKEGLWKFPYLPFAFRLGSSERLRTKISPGHID